MGIVKKGCTEIKLKKIQNVYRKYFNDYDYDEEKHSMIQKMKMKNINQELGLEELLIELLLLLL